MLTADYFISLLELEPHVEGGFYRETYRCNHAIRNGRYGNEKSLSTVIYFLLRSGDISRFHQLRSDEMWLFHCGSAVHIHTIDHHGNHEIKKLGLNVNENEQPQILISANTVFGAELPEGDFALMSCLVSPGFDFQDFKLFDAEELISYYPQHAEIIHRLNG